MAALREYHLRDLPTRFLSLSCRRTSVGGQLPHPPHLSLLIRPPFTWSLCGMLLQVHLLAGFSVFRKGWHHVKVFGRQWDKVSSTEVLKKWRKRTLHIVCDGVEGSIDTLRKGPRGDIGEGVIPRSMGWYVDEFDQKVPWKSTDYIDIKAMNFVSSW